MINFKSIFYKNFQAVGNSGITIYLDKSQNTLLGGDNGSGKSTVLEAISYCLFGKPLKKVKLSGLINSMNKKNMLTECVFNKHGDEYKVIRGEKPKKFEIHKNGEVLDQNAASKDYQATLERILGMDHKLFTQVVLLNRERYIPFMDMGAADRRKVVEDILDINIFSYMTKIVKQEIQTIKTQISDLEYERGISKTKLEGVEKLIEQAKSNIDGQVQQYRETISNNISRINELMDESHSIEERIKALDPDLKEYETLDDKKNKFNDIAKRFSSRMNELKKEKSFYDDNDTCPTCTQDIDSQFKETIIQKIESKQDQIKEKSSELFSEVQSLINRMKVLSEALDKKAGLEKELRGVNSEIDFLKRENSGLSDKIKSLSKQTVDDDLLDKKTDLESKIKQMDDSLTELFSECEQYETMANMLKDDGIKATIVDDYVGFINKKMNEYLNHMGFFINITLDGNFNEQVNSINRSNFTYDNLSTGQKTRVNLAILMVLLEVSAMKNSAVCNLLFIDELLENLDQDGVALFMSLIKEKVKGKNVFVVSQRFDEFKDYFRSEIRFELGEDGYTKIV